MIYLLAENKAGKYRYPTSGYQTMISHPIEQTRAETAGLCRETVLEWKYLLDTDNLNERKGSRDRLKLQMVNPCQTYCEHPKHLCNIFLFSTDVHNKKDINHVRAQPKYLGLPSRLPVILLVLD